MMLKRERLLQGKGYRDQNLINNDIEDFYRMQDAIDGVHTSMTSCYLPLENQSIQDVRIRFP